MSKLAFIFLILTINQVYSNHYGVLREPLNGTFASNRLTTGPIFILDTRTILVTQFVYANKAIKNLRDVHNKWFKCKVHSNDKLFNLEFENGTDAHINQRKYYGGNIILKVPGFYDFDVRQLSEVLIVNDKNETKTSVAINERNVQDLRKHSADLLFVNGVRRFFYPKCCEGNSFLLDGICTEFDKSKEMLFSDHLKIHDVKDFIYYETNAFDKVFHDPFFAPTNCSITLVEKDYNATLLINSEILINESPNVKLACIDWVAYEETSNVLEKFAFVCVDDFNTDSLISGATSNQQVLPSLSTHIFFIFTFYLCSFL